MQLKGLVKFFTVALILISLYQLSFTFVVHNVEKKAQFQAERRAKMENPEAQGKELERLVEKQFQRITDSLNGEVVMDVPLLKKYTFLEAKEQELNLGLDLQGGMNVTLEVSLDELIRSMSNNPADATLNAAIARANQLKVNSQENFVTLFGRAFEQENPGASLAYLFTKPSQDDITLNTPNAKVIDIIAKEANGAIHRTYNVLLTRIDKFGVAQPSVNLDANRGIITVELAGMTDPERVRSYLQSTARLEFHETFENQEIIGPLQSANQALAAYLSGIEEEEKAKAGVDRKEDEVAATETSDSAATPAAELDRDTASLAQLLGAGAGADTGTATLDNQMRDNPLFSVWYPNITPEGAVVQSPVVGMVMKRDTAKLNEYLALDVVRNKFPNNVKFVYGAENKKDARDPNAPLYIYALKLAPGIGGAKLEGDRVTDARMDYNPMTGKPEVSMSMDASGARIWKKMTGDNVGKFVAVVLDDKVYSAPLVNGEIAGGNTAISGNFTVEEATDLANILKSGKLPAPARIVQEQVVGPTLGAESIDAGFKAIILSFLAIFILMLVYYNSSGWVANISLTLNLLFTVGVLSALHATLTMPGIAGLVLGIGMAVDAHVLIFERIKEELTRGKSHEQSIIDGYKRSMAPVLDGHLTQLITAIILFYFGLGPVLGFATTQILSISISLFCGILVSRLIKEMYLGWGKHYKYFTPVSRAVFNKANFDFMKIRKTTYVVSAALALLGLSSFFHGFDYGVEFTGGRSFTVALNQAHPVGDVREHLEPYFGEYPIVKTIGAENQLNITTGYLIHETGLEVEGQVQQKLYEGLSDGNFLAPGVSLEDFRRDVIQSSQTVLPTISDDLIQGAKWATILSLLAISAYILLRFRRWQYSLGTILSLIFNVLVTMAVFSYFKDTVPFALEIDQHFIAALLTVIGFSINDTIIVFDRIREYFRKGSKEPKKVIINRAINDTLPRTIMTSLTLFIVVLILFIVGGDVTRGFAFAMLIGIITGTYSSIFVAAPILVDMDKKDQLHVEVDHSARIEELKKMA